MTEQEIAIIHWCREMVQARRFAELATTLVGSIGTSVTRGASRDFMGMSFDLACRAILVGENRSAEALSQVALLCQQSLTKFGVQPWSSLYQGCLLHLAGDHDHAVPPYLLAGAETEILWPGSNGCKSVFTLSAARQAVTSGIGANDTINARGTETQRPVHACNAVILVAADCAYFRKFGDAFFTSVRRHGTDVGVHLHLINPEQTDLDAIAKHAADGTWPELVVTTEAYCGPDAGTYYALSRFLIAPTLLEQYQRPLLITDIDAVYHSRVVLKQVKAPMDVGLRMKRDGFCCHPWQTVKADYVVYAPTAMSHRFAWAVAAISRSIFAERKGKFVWFLDQNALYYTLLLSRLDEWGVSVVDLNQQDLPGSITFSKSAAPNLIASF